MSSVCFFMLSVNSLCSIVLLPSSGILTNFTLFIFDAPNTTVSLFTVKKKIVFGYACVICICLFVCWNRFLYTPFIDLVFAVISALHIINYIMCMFCSIRVVFRKHCDCERSSI